MSLDLSQLNPSQCKAVEAPPGHCLIIAGPGTGKTLTLTYRIAYLILKLGVNPEEILAITFTQKAAEEIKKRVGELIRQSGFEGRNGPSIGTFHSFGLEILRKEGEQIGLPPIFRILAEVEQSEIIKEIISEIMPEEPLRKFRQWRQKISEQKNLLLSSHCFSPILSVYENRLQELQALDFDDLILKPLFLLQHNREVKNKYQNRFHHILVDEYQDLNLSQYFLLKELCGPQTYLWVVGDADQAIYAFRGANVEYFLRFQQDYPQAHCIYLEKNYRSTAPILLSAQAVIKNNSHRIPNPISPVYPEGPPLYLWEASDHYAEARWVVKEIERLVGGTQMESYDGRKEMFGFSEIAILYRFHQLSFSLTPALQEAGLPYQIIGTEGNNEDSILGYLILFLKLLVNPGDEFSFRALLSAEDKLIENQEKLVALINKFQKESKAVNLEKLITNIFQEIGGKEKNKISPYLALAEPFGKGSADKQISQFLETLLLLKAGDTYNPKIEAITLMTVHAAKGLEFPVVFIVGLEEGIFPWTNLGEGSSDLEEERRLFYVGITRAKQRLYLSFAQERYLFGEKRKNSPSPFLFEIPADNLIRLTDFQKPAKKKPPMKQRSLF